MPWLAAGTRLHRCPKTCYGPERIPSSKTYLRSGSPNPEGTYMDHNDGTPRAALKQRPRAGVADGIPLLFEPSSRRSMLCVALAAWGLVVSGNESIAGATRCGTSTRPIRPPPTRPRAKREQEESSVGRCVYLTGCLSAGGRKRHCVRGDRC